MATYESARSITGIVGSAITEYRFVTLAADGQYDHSASAQGNVDGISGETVATVGRDFPLIVADGGLSKIEAGATVAVGDLVATDTVGRAITHVAAVDNVAVGRARTGGAIGEIISIQFMHMRTDAG